MTSISIREYFAEVGSRFTQADARIIGPVLEELGAEGNVTPAEVVEAAQSSNNPLHVYFEWDDPVAARAYRETQAAEMIRVVRVRVVSATADQVTRAYHVRRPPGADGEGPAKRSIRVGDDRVDDLARAALADLEEWAAKYAPHLRLFGRFSDLFRTVASQIGEFKEEYESGHLSGPYRKVIRTFLDFMADGEAEVPRAYGAQLRYMIEAIEDVKAGFAELAPVIVETSDEAA